MPDSYLPPKTKSEAQQRFGVLVGAAIATVVIWQVPWGNLLLYPFSVLAVWFHEMGHGLTAQLLGGDFRQLILLPNGGIAVHAGTLWGGRLGRAMVAAGGPLGPAIAGSLLIMAAKRTTWCAIALAGLGGSLLISLIWVRGGFGLVSVLGWAVIILLIARAPVWLQQFAVPFLGVQACISTYRQLDYLFTREAVIGGQRLLSDSGQIAQQLFLPYWFWGGLLGLMSLSMLLGSLWWTYGRTK